MNPTTPTTPDERRSRRPRAAVVGLLVLATFLLLGRTCATSPSIPERAPQGHDERTPPLPSSPLTARPLAGSGPHGAPSPSGHIVGDLRSAGAGAPLAGLSVCAIHLHTTDRVCTSTASDGRFDLALPLGLHRLVLADDTALLTGCDAASPSTTVEITLTAPLQERHLRALGAAQIVEGIVFDRLGGVVVGALVEPTALADESAAAALCAAALSDDDGRFRLPLPDGIFTLRASAPGYGVGHVDDASADALAEITLAPAARLRGRLTGAPPLGGHPVHAAREATGRWHRLATVLSDADGTFAFDDLPPGRYLLTAEADLRYGLAEADLARPLDEADVVVSLGPGARLGAALVQGPPDRPCPFGHLTLRHSDLGLVFSALADEAGHATLSGLPAGAYEVTARCGALPLRDPQGPLILAGDTHATWTFVAGGALHGEVHDDRGPLAGARVIVLPDAPDTPPATALTDDRGAFRLEALAPGDHEVLLVHQGAGDEPDPVRVTITPGREAVVHLRAPTLASLTGHAHDRHGLPCVGAEVRAERTGGAFASARVDARGRFVLRGLDPDTYRVRLVDDAPDPASAVDVRLLPGPPTELTLTCIAHDAQLRGRALDSAGDPLADHLVEATPLADDGPPRFERTTRPALTQSDGAFTLSALTEGPHLLTLRTPAGVEVTTLTADTDAVRDILLRAPATAAATGTITAPDIASLSPSILRIDHEDGTLARTIILPPGATEFHLKDLPRARYRVRASTAEGHHAEAPLDLTAPAPPALHLVLHAP